MGTEMKITNWEQDFLHHRMLSSVKTADFISDRMSYIVLRGRWCYIIVLNVHALREEINDDSKYHFLCGFSASLIDLANKT
jgi:hypothetical protein